MKIGISINTSWNVFNFRKGIVLDLLKEGNEVFVIAPKDDYSIKLEELGCVFIELPMKGKSYNPFIDLLLLFRYVFIIRKLDLDYLLRKNLYFNVTPMFKMHTNTFSKNSGSLQPYYLGVYTGLNYKF